MSRFIPVLVVAALVTSRPGPIDVTSFRLAFLGHEIGSETDTWTSTDGGRHLAAAFQFVDRGTTVSLSGELDVTSDGSARRFVVKGRNYRLFTSDSAVTIDGASATVRDLQRTRVVELATPHFFPIDNYAPIGAQEALIQYWRAHGRPAAIQAAPSGPTIRIAQRAGVVGGSSQGGVAPTEVLSIDGVVWGRETAFVDGSSGRLLALATWAGALPFEAIRDEPGARVTLPQLLRDAAMMRVDDLVADTRRLPLGATGAYALVGATVIPGTSAPAISPATVIVRDGRIAAVGPAVSTPVPRGMTRIDVAGRTIIAGLWDMHAHASQTDWAAAYLASGVTTIRDMGGETPFLVAMRDAIESGQALGPRYLLAGLVDGPGPHAFGAVTAATPGEGIAVTRRYHDDRFQEMKIYGDVSPEVVPAIVEEAHRLGMTVTGHVPAGLSAQRVVEMGFDGIAHMQLRGEPGSAESTAQIAFFKAHGTVMDPTQSWNELSGHPASIPLDELLPGVEGLPVPLARMFGSMSLPAGDAAAYRTRQRASLRLLKDAVDAGLLVVAGTDKGVPGFSLAREIELYVAGGMTPLEAIQTATIMPARAMRLDKELGTVEAGKRADLVILGGDPLADIAHVRDVRQVVTRGRLYEAAALQRMGGFK